MPRGIRAPGTLLSREEKSGKSRSCRLKSPVRGLGRRKGLGEELFWGGFAPGPFGSQGEPFGAQGNLKPRPPEEWRRADPPFANITFRFEACEKFSAEVLRTSLSDALRMTSVGRSETKKTPPSCGGRKGRAPLKDARVRHPARTWSSFELSTCHGPSTPRPTFARRERKKKSAIPVGMTEGSPPRNIIRGAKNAPRKAAATTAEKSGPPQKAAATKARGLA